MRQWFGVPFGFACVAAICFAGCTGDSQGSPSRDGGAVDDGSPSDGAATDSANRGDTAIGEAGGDAPTGEAGSDAPTSGNAGDGGCAVGELPSPACNAIVASGPQVVTTTSSGDAPQPQGGVVPDGTYVLQYSTYYGGVVASQTFQTTWVICGDHWDVAENSIAADGGGLPLHVNYTATLQGSSVALNPVCSSMQSFNAPRTVGISVSGSEITFFENVGGLTLVSMQARQ